MKKIICAVTNDLHQDQRMKRICSCLAECGYEVLLVGRIKTSSSKFYTEGFEYSRLRCIFNKGPLFYLEYNFRLFILLISTPFDAVNAVDLDTLPACRTVSLFRNKYCVFDAHEWFEEVPELIDRPFVKQIWKWIAKLFLIRSKYNYTVNQSLARKLEETYAVPFDTIGNFPVYVREKGKPYRSGEEWRVLYQGMLNKGRGLDLILEFMRKSENVKLIIAGFGDLAESLNRLIKKEEKLRQTVEVAGFVEPEDLPELTRTCHIGLNLLDPKSKSYCFSSANKYFDYIMAGLPCISMDFPEYRRLNSIYETSILIRSLDYSELNDAFDRLLGNREYYLSLKENCHKASQIWQWKFEAEKVFNFYKNLPV